MSEVAILLQPRWLSQRAAAKYMGLSVTYFRANVHVQPKPVCKPQPGAKPVMRYDRGELDQWVAACATIKGSGQRRAS